VCFPIPDDDMCDLVRGRPRVYAGPGWRARYLARIDRRRRAARGTGA